MAFTHEREYPSLRLVSRVLQLWVHMGAHVVVETSFSASVESFLERERVSNMFEHTTTGRAVVVDNRFEGLKDGRLYRLRETSSTAGVRSPLLPPICF